MNKQNIPPYDHEKYLDFNDPGQLQAAREMVDEVRSKLGKVYPLFINGKESKGDKGTFKSINPCNTDETVGIFQKASKEQAKEALQLAWKAFEDWQHTPAQERADLMFKAADIARRRKLEIIAWEVTEVGQNFWEADAQVAEGIDFLEYYARQALRYDEGMEVINSQGDTNRTIYLPIGAGISLSPWNFPFAIAIGMACGPIVAGNTVVAKPAPESPMMTQIIREIFEEAGLPDGVFNFVTGDDIEVGENLVRDPDTRFINFTGSKAVGLHIQNLANTPFEGQKWLKRVSAEMGGKNAMIVDSDSDLDLAADAIVTSAFGFQGQKCSAGSRALIMEDVYDELQDKVVEKTKALDLGNAKENHLVNAVVSEEQYDKVLQYIDIGKNEGTLLAGGDKADTAEPGYYIQPTVFGDVAPDARIATEEIFGPVLALVSCKSLDEAINVANSVEYGLTGGFISNNEDNIDRVMRDFHVGNLYINRKCTGSIVGAQPFGGFYLSGTDPKAGGADYLGQFLQSKSITERPKDGVKQILNDFEYANK